MTLTRIIHSTFLLILFVIEAALGVQASIAQETVLYNFGAAGSPTTPNTTLVFDSDGNLYGTATGGFTAGGNVLEGGAVFELSPSQSGSWTMNEIYAFNSDGVAANGVIFDANKANLYGTTQSGGANGAGSVFELSPSGGSTWTATTLYSFQTTGSDGYAPEAGLIFDSDGNLYGTTNAGGSAGQGTVFELSPGSGNSWTEKILYSFQATGNDGHSPRSAPLVMDSKGNLYGITYAGGNPLGTGTAFELSPGAGGSWTEQVLHTFGIEDTPDAAIAASGLTLDADGNLYGTSSGGGDHNSGTVYEISPMAGGGWTETVLYSFSGGTTGSIDGESPVGGVVFDVKGDLIGTTFHGGSYNSQGTIYELTPAGGQWTEKVLYNFADKTMNDGFDPTGNLTFDSSGNLYGVATEGGNQDYGAAFKFAVPTPVAAKPTFSPAPGIYSSEQEVKIMDATPGAAIYYTTNGDQPSSSSTRYEGPVVVTETETIKAIATAVGYSESPVASATYTIAKPAAAPEITPVAGTYITSVTVKITDSTPQATIYYTTNGTAPTTASARYTAEIKISASETIKAIASAAGLAPSKIASAAFKIQTAKPVFSLAQGKYNAAQTVKITDATPGANIYYTTNGKTPTNTSTKYTGKIKVSTSETIKAIAIANGDTESVVAMAGYVILKPAATPVIKPDGGAVAKGTSVTITDSTKGATIYYTTNGAAPTAKSTKYTKAFTVSANETVKAMAIASGDANSAVATAKFTIM